jgi:excisionase family DNA binding protein
VRCELQAALELARELDAADLPYFLGELETVRVVAQARLASPAIPAPLDKLLTVEQAAARMNCSPDFLYRNHKRLPFTRKDKVGRKLLFSSLGLDAYLRKPR